MNLGFSYLEKHSRTLRALSTTGKFDTQKLRKQDTVKAFHLTALMWREPARM